jgi:hypothetical protein
MFEFKSGTVLFVLSLSCSFGESCLLVSWCACGRCGKACNDEDGVGDLVQSTGDDRTCRILGGRMIEKSGDVMCGLYRAHRDKECGFLG